MFDSNQFFGGGAGDFYPVSIDQSLRFNDNDSAYLSRTPASAGNRKTWTWSGWVKRGNIGTNQSIIRANGSGDTGRTDIWFDTNDDLLVAGSSTYFRITDQKFRDVSAWYHLVFQFDTTQASADDRLKIYVNGVQVTSFSTNNAYAENTDYGVNATVSHNIGSGYGYLDGYLAEVHFTDGTAYDADAFGELKSGVWVAKSPSVTYGTNGFYLDFANSADIGNDVSGEGNDWTPNNFTASDVVLDSPTDNFCTWNPLTTSYSGATLSDGNLRAVTGTSQYGALLSTFAVSSGKYYVEFNDVSGLYSIFGCFATTKTPSTTTGLDSAGTGSIGYKKNSGNISIDGTETSYGASWSNGDVIGMALNLDDNEVTFYKNGSSQGTRSISALEYYIGASDNDGGSGITVVLNAGQSGFTYTPPTGYLALSTANLPDPSISPADDASPEDYFNTVLYTGNSGTGSPSTQAVTGVGFEPDFLWVKDRTSTRNHILIDQLRGDSTFLKSNETDAEATNADVVSSLDADGFTVGVAATCNFLDNAYVAWNWKANGSGVSNTDGSITSTVSANTEAGFSIVGYTDTGSATTMGHGLSQTPELIIQRNRGSSNWYVVTTVIDGSVDFLLLDSTSAKTDSSITAPTPTVFTSTQIAGTTIAYCFHSVEGFSKFGSYTGNGSADGPFVYTGFRPAFVLVKNASAVGDWFIYDTDRDTGNVNDSRLKPNRSDAEGTGGSYGPDILSNGFKMRTNFGELNGSGNTIIYMAFADDGGAFKYSLAR